MLAVLSDLGPDVLADRSNPHFMMTEEQHSEASGSEFDLRLKDDSDQPEVSPLGDELLKDGHDEDRDIKPVFDDQPRCSSSNSSRRHKHSSRRHSAGGRTSADTVVAAAEAKTISSRTERSAAAAAAASSSLASGAPQTDEERLMHFQSEAQRRENILVMRLASKEQQLHDYFTQLEELRSSLTGGLRTSLLDPVVNSMFQKMKQELKDTKLKLEQSQQELSAWKFTPDSSTGKRLMARCRTLIQENEELGKLVEHGRLARLQGELASQAHITGALQKEKQENEELLVELDQDMEGLQTTVMFLQTELDKMKVENQRLRSLLGMPAVDMELQLDTSAPDQDRTTAGTPGLTDAADNNSQLLAMDTDSLARTDKNRTRHSSNSSGLNPSHSTNQHNGRHSRQQYATNGDRATPTENGYARPGDRDRDRTSRSPPAKRTKQTPLDLGLEEEEQEDLGLELQRTNKNIAPRASPRPKQPQQQGQMRGRRGRGRPPSHNTGNGRGRSPRKGAGADLRHERQYRDNGHRYSQTQQRDNRTRTHQPMRERDMDKVSD